MSITVEDMLSAYALAYDTWLDPESERENPTPEYARLIRQVVEHEHADLQAENEQLRELVRISIECCNSGTCDECPIQGEDGSCPYIDMARELGVEV